MSGTIWRALGCIALLGLATPAVAQTAAQTPAHLGVQTCAGDNCHGAVKRIAGSPIPQNEYFVWSQKDKHSQSYATLRQPRALSIARNLGLADAEHSSLCLDCHADNVPTERRGPQFQLSDGVGCESCHGGAEGWFGTHLVAADHKANVAAGMYPTDQPAARAALCLSCHLGNEQRFVAHRLHGAGHPPIPFELDTYTAIEPAHFVVDKTYVERKDRPNDLQIWAIGQAIDVKLRMDLILDPKNAPKGVDIEESLFDCQSCHHSISELQWQARASSGLGPGQIKLYDATAVMLGIAAQRVAPDAAKALRDHMPALHAATGQSWDAVKHEATAVRDAANALIPALAAHNFDKADAKALADGVIASALDGGDLDYSGAQQQVMALESIVAALKPLGFVDDPQLVGVNDALRALYAAVADDRTYRPAAYADALKAFKAKLPL